MTTPAEIIVINHRNAEQNGMNEYERVTLQSNQSNEVARRREERTRRINNIPNYHTGNRVHHIRTIQLPFMNMWNELFGNDVLHPHLRNYAEASIRFAEDQTHTRLFAGQMEVSLIMQENYRVGVHLAIFIVQLFPHRQFHDGHVIQTEFSEGSYTHQTINRLFDPNYNAVVSQATEYSILEYLAEEHEMTDILYDCFMDPDFRPMRFSYINDEEYIVDPNGNDDHHQWHEFQDQDAEDDAEDDADADADSDADTEIAAIVMPPPPPPPALNNNHFEQIYHYYYNNNIYNDDDDDSDDSDDRDDSESDGESDSESDGESDSESDSDDYEVRG